LFFNRLLELIDALIRPDGAFRKPCVAFRNGLDRVGELRFDQAAHLRNAIGKRVQLLGKGLHNVLVHA
jgi:hypothetical protein